MDYSSRQRYLERRKAAQARRRRLLLIGGILAILGIGVAGAIWFGRGTPQPVAGEPTSQAATPTVEGQPTSVAATPTTSAQAGSGEPPAATIPPPEQPAQATFFDDQRLTYEPNFYAPQIQAFLDSQPGPLKGIFLTVGSRRHSLAEVLVGQTSYYSVNPKVMLALLEMNNGLISNANASADALNWAMNMRGENGRWRGLSGQLRWTIRQIVQAKSAYPTREPLTFANNASMDVPQEWSLSQYVIARIIAPTTTPDRLNYLMQAFLDSYTRLFGDPRSAPSDWSTPAEPFLYWPLEEPFQVTSFFDHGGPFLTRNAAEGIMTYWGRRETDLAFAYNGHDGWDYAAAPPSLALAAADGDVVFAGNADDNCATTAVVIDHRNGYRTLYWHLARVDVQIGQQVTRGDSVGMVGESGCAQGAHLHFGVQFLGRNIDPYGWCGSEPDPWAEHPAGVVSRWLWADRPSPCEAPPAGAIVVDDNGPGFLRSGDGWQSVPTGYGGSASYIASMLGVDNHAWDLGPAHEPAQAIYQPQEPVNGKYRVMAYIPYALSGLDDARQVRYRILHAGGETSVDADLQVSANDWIDLGTYDFTAGHAAVIIDNQADDTPRSIWADAVIWLPVP